MICQTDYNQDLTPDCHRGKLPQLQLNPEEEKLMDNTKPVRVLRMKDLPSKVGFQPSTIYQLVAEGKFPAPHKLVPGGKASGWLESTIDSWLESAARHSKEVQ